VSTTANASHLLLELLQRARDGGGEGWMGFAASMVLWRGTAVARESTRARAVKERDKDRASENRGPRRRERERDREREGGRGRARI